jgi:hypothetical protein
MNKLENCEYNNKVIKAVRMRTIISALVSTLIQSSNYRSIKNERRTSSRKFMIKGICKFISYGRGSARLWIYSLL